MGSLLTTKDPVMNSSGYPVQTAGRWLGYFRVSYGRPAGTKRPLAGSSVPVSGVGGHAAPAPGRPAYGRREPPAPPRSRIAIPGFFPVLLGGYASFIRVDLYM